MLNWVKAKQIENQVLWITDTRDQRGPKNLSKSCTQHWHKVRADQCIEIIQPWKFLPEHPYRADLRKGLEFCEKILDRIDEHLVDLEDVFFSDEVHFETHGNANKRNMQYYATRNPSITHATSLHSLHVTIRCATSAKLIIKPYFFRSGGFEGRCQR